MHDTQAVMTSTYIVRQNGHARMADMIRVKSSKVGTILPRDHHAKLHVIASAIANIHGKHESEQQVARSFVP